MFARVQTGCAIGLDGVPVSVEVDVANGLPSFTIVGLADRAVDESRERVKSALRNSKATLPAQKITVNLAPSDLPKEGTLYDLPIAIGVLTATGQLEGNILPYYFVGELSLDGNVRGVSGVLPVTLLARENGVRAIFVPVENAAEAAIVDGIEILPVRTLKDVFLHLNGQVVIQPAKSPVKVKEERYSVDFSDMRGQESVKRALEIAVAGGHNVLLHGPPGAGKTMAARALPSILPALSFEEMLEVTKIYSVSGMLDGESLMVRRPYRSPHHSISAVGLIGGGRLAGPGEVSLAHRGVLFLDEFPEFSRSVLESLRQPLEDGVVTISRAKRRVTYPASFILVASANPCPCGYYGDVKHECRCSTASILRYRQRLSGPLLDRIDIHVSVPAVSLSELTSGSSAGEISADIRARVSEAHERQKKRFEGCGILYNGEMGAREIEKFAKVELSAEKVLVEASEKLSLSARGYHKTLKVARSIADLAGDERVVEDHVLEALAYRQVDRI